MTRTLPLPPSIIVRLSTACSHMCHSVSLLFHAEGNLAPVAEVQEWIITSGLPVRATYCKCRKAKESCADDMNMVQCSNENCRNMLGEHNANWFHYGCVSFNPDVDTDYYCTDNCRSNQKKRKTR